jgi:hypothetical protein
MVSWKALALIVLLGASACEKPNLESTGGGYSRGDTLPEKTTIDRRGA